MTSTMEATTTTTSSVIANIGNNTATTTEDVFTAATTAVNNDNTTTGMNLRKASNASTMSSSQRSTRSNNPNSNSSSINININSRLPRKKRKESNDTTNTTTTTAREEAIPPPPMTEGGEGVAAATTSSSFPDLGLRAGSDDGSTTRTMKRMMMIGTELSETAVGNTSTTTNICITNARKSSHDTTTVCVNSTSAGSNCSHHSFGGGVGPLPSLSLPSSLDGIDFLATTTARQQEQQQQQSSSMAVGPIIIDNNMKKDCNKKTGKRERSESATSQQQPYDTSRQRQQQQLVPSLQLLSTSNTISSMSDHLNPLPLRTTTTTTISGAIDDNSSHDDETFASSGHRVLMEAIMMSGCAGSSSTTTVTAVQASTSAAAAAAAAMGDANDGGCGGSNSSKTPLEQIHSSFAVAGGGGGKNTTFPYRDRLDSTASSSFRYNIFNGRRDRLESWGGMSDLSVGPNASDSVIASAVAAATNLHNGLLFEDPDHDDVMGDLPALQMSASFSHEDQKLGAIPSKISVPPYRDRLGSIASLGDLSLTNMNNGSNLTIDGIDVPGADLQAFVAAAMASVGDQLIELAGNIEELTGESITSEDLQREFITLNEAADCSVASPMIGAVSDSTGGRRPRAWSTSSRLPVDIEAVNAAVEAAYSVGMVQETEKPVEEVKSHSNATRPNRMLKRPLPTKKTRNEINASSSSQSTISEKSHQSDIVVAKGKSSRKRSRKSEVSATESIKKGSTRKMAPLKKRPLEKISNSRKSVTPSSEAAIAAMKTPVVSNRTRIQPVLSDFHMTPSIVLSMTTDDNNKKGDSGGGDSGGACGQANQKWENMFECMLEFGEERKADDTKDMTDDEKKAYIWDGNVPTNYKSKDGLALGRWVNNQRSAKAKGTLKDDREQRLIGAGLKWSVLASNSWNEMLEELTIYIKDQHRQGKVWDGNVPTNYQIKSRPDGEFNGEEINLGRWVNRQRSLYQSEKLRPDRKVRLEGVGLKWSMLATTSWDGMYDTLKEYAEQYVKRNGGGEKWDGNVPANYRTNDNPPRALGRWVHRQRSNFAKKKLKQEFVDKLTELGLKWSIHHRPGEMDDDGEFGDEFEDPVETILLVVESDQCVRTTPAESDGGKNDDVAVKGTVSKEVETMTRSAV